MSQHTVQKRRTAPDIQNRKGGEPIVALTSYHAHTAAIADKYVDFLLVGDSLGMVMHGFESTLPVPLDLMIMHGRAVMRGAKQSLIVVDMPFGSYEESPQQAFRNAARVVKETECGAIKLEGGKRMGETIRFLSERGIPVMAHVGLTPQSINVLGGFKAQGRERAQWRRLRKTRKWWLKLALSQWCWRRSPNPWRRRSRQPSTFPPSASAHQRLAMGRYWSWKICWA